MPIIFDENKRAFRIRTPKSEYQFAVSRTGRLFHRYYGAPISDVAENVESRSGHSSFHVGDYEEDHNFAPDLYPQEIGFSGCGDYRSPSLSIRGEKGDNCTDARYRSHRIVCGKPAPEGLPHLFAAGEDDAETLEVELYDAVTGAVITLFYTVFARHDAIVRRMRITNSGSAPFRLEDVKSLCLDLPGCDYDLVDLFGDYGHERMEQRRPIGHGIETVASARGASGHVHNPFVALTASDAGEETGDVIGACLVYSGSFSAHIEVNATADTRLVFGIHERDFSWELCPGQMFDTPEAVLVFSSSGLGGMSRAFHRLFGEHLISPRWQRERRPLLVNSWEAAYFNFNEEKLYDFAVRAKELGIEMLVMDDGWFGKRNRDNSSLGDWYVNEEKLRGGLGALVGRVHDLGMKFGIWFEPEMISPDSDLFRAHPDWCLHTDGRRQSDARYQYVLDMSNPTVVDAVWDMMKNILDSCRIDYVKWDYNRNFSEASSSWLDAAHQGELGHRSILGTYELQRRLVETYPDILLENCSGGGGRFDAGMLFYSPQIWCSDTTDPIERLGIQFGTSLCYPASCVGAHISASGRAPLLTKCRIAAWGTNGYELDPGRYTEEEKKTVQAEIAAYHETYDLIRKGDLYRLVKPQDNRYFCAWEFVSPDRREALVTVVNLMAAPVTNRILRPRGLDPEKRYVCTSTDSRIPTASYKGDTWMRVGVNLCETVRHDYTSLQLHFCEVTED